MRAERAFIPSADAFDGRPRTQVARVGVQAYAQRLPHFKCMGQHQQLGLGVRSSSNRIASQPGIADLAGVGVLAAMPWVARRPKPALNVAEARGTKDRAVFLTNDRKWERAALGLRTQSCLNIALGLGASLRDQTPCIERRIDCRGG